jgi:hypothetical protein
MPIEPFRTAQVAPKSEGRMSADQLAATTMLDGNTNHTASKAPFDIVGGVGMMRQRSRNRKG